MGFELSAKFDQIIQLAKYPIRAVIFAWRALSNISYRSNIIRSQARDNIGWQKMPYVECSQIRMQM